MLEVLDVFYTILHLAIIGFNLFGWIWPSLRKVHLLSILITAGSWLILGIWFGIGYCPITDWQWQVKEQLGERNLPASFIKYYADKIAGRSVSASLVNTMTAVLFAAVAFLSIVLNVVRIRRERVKQ